MANQRSNLVIQEMVDFSVTLIQSSKHLSIPASVINQVIRSATSIGANFSEAQDASSKKDFINKIYISKKESAETEYWLSIIHQLSPKTESINELSQQAHRFTMLLQKIINTSKTSKS
mgnify:CR=1 FL=1